MADAEDVRRLALALPHVEEIDSDGFDFRVAGKGFVWSYPERLPGKPRRIRTDIAVLYVGDEAEKQALLLGEPGIFFTASTYGGWPLVLVRLAEVDAGRLAELVTDAWRMRGGTLLPAPDELRFRAAERGDAQAVAALHTDSWQRHYRGAYSDAFLDEEAPGFLLDLWTRRLASPGQQDRTILAELDQEGDGDRMLVGMAHTVLDNNPTWGALLDNLHVAYSLKRQGVGTRLLSLTAQAVLAEKPGSGLYLWVLEQNMNGRAFYEARGGTCVESREVVPPGGDPARLNGKPRGLRYTWPRLAPSPPGL
jgi:GNAT superfamily N-acetyltransferase